MHLATTPPVPERVSVLDRPARSRQERMLFERYQALGERRDRDELVERFMPLARSLAQRFGNGAPQDDLTQVAAIGLIKAVERFDPGREIAFSSYAVPTITGELKRYFRDRTWAIRPPRDLQELALKLDKALAELSEDLHRQPSITELASAVGASDEKILEAIQAQGAYRATSLDAPRHADSHSTPMTLGESLGVSEDGFAQVENRAMLAQMLTALTPREQEILRLRFEQDMTQAEIGDIMGVSQMQISRILRQTLTRLRDADDAHVPDATGLDPRGRRASREPQAVAA